MRKLLWLGKTVFVTGREWRRELPRLDVDNAEFDEGSREYTIEKGWCTLCSVERKCSECRMAVFGKTYGCITLGRSYAAAHGISKARFGRVVFGFAAIWWHESDDDVGEQVMNLLYEGWKSMKWVFPFPWRLPAWKKWMSKLRRKSDDKSI